jgi:hypothetical protein
MSSVPFLSAVSFASPRRCTSGAGMTPGSGAGLTLLVRSSVMACLLPKRNWRVPDLNREERDSHSPNLQTNSTLVMSRPRFNWSAARTWCLRSMLGSAPETLMARFIR